MKKGYKATDNLKCLTLTYEVGKTYEISNKEMCSHGFHYCENLDDTLLYYDYDKDNTVFIEIEDLDPESLIDGSKTVSTKIKVLRIVDKSELKQHEFDEHGNLIKDRLHTYTYDDKGRLLTMYDIFDDGINKTPKLIECNVYDQFGNHIKQTKTDGYFWEKEYNELGIATSFKSSSGETWTKEIDFENRTYTFKDIYGAYEIVKYDEEWRIIEFENSHNVHYKREYNEFGDLIKHTQYYKYSSDLVQTYTYDEFGNRTSCTATSGDGDGCLVWKAEFNEQGKELLHETSNIKTTTEYLDDSKLVVLTCLDLRNDSNVVSVTKRYHDDKGNLIKCENFYKGKLIQDWEITIN